MGYICLHITCSDFQVSPLLLKTKHSILLNKFSSQTLCHKWKQRLVALKMMKDTLACPTVLLFNEK